MHILLIHQAFVSPKQAGGTRHFEFAKYLRKKGHNVTIITSNLNYLAGTSLEEGVSFIKEEQIEGIRILRVYTPPVLHKSFVWRVIAFLVFMITSIIAGLQVGSIDLVMGTTPPIFQTISAWFLAKIRRKPFLLEVRDLWPAFAIDIGVLTNPFLIVLSSWLEKFLYEQADHILVNSPAYSDYIHDRGIPSEEISLIPNGVNPDMFHLDIQETSIRQQWNLEKKCIVTYTGALGMANDIPTILHAAKRLQEEMKIHFLLVGDGKERRNLEKLAKQLRLTNVTFTGSYPKTDIPSVLTASDVCVATLKDISMFRTTYPNKVFDYMASGRPTILGIDGVIRKVIEASEGGIFVPPGDDVALADAVYQLCGDEVLRNTMGQKARKYVVSHFNRELHAQAFYELVTRLVFKD